MAERAEFERHPLPSGDIEYVSTRLGAPVAREEPDRSEPSKRQFRTYSNGVNYLTEREWDSLHVFAGWDLDGSAQAALDANEYD